ncbi:MAG: hypothetical protein PsegKO_14500 [Pseudohongiellaceae bacterium]
MKKIVIIAIVVILAGGGGSAYLLGFFPSSSVAEAKVAAPGEDAGHGEGGDGDSDSQSNYMSINPPFVVNFTHLGTLRFLQISLAVMYQDEQYIERVTDELPAIRNELILLLSDQKFEKLNTLTGKQELRGEMIAAINNRILHEDETDVHGEVFITNFVMQ